MVITKFQDMFGNTIILKLLLVSHLNMKVRDIAIVLCINVNGLNLKSNKKYRR